MIKTSLRTRPQLATTGRSVAGYWLALPGIAALLVLFIVPTVAVFAIALTDWQIGTDQFSFIGLRNFRILAIDPDFRSAVFNTVAYALMMAPTTFGLGLITALLIESAGALRGFYRVAHFLPAMATMSAMAIAWEALLHPTVGLVNHVVTDLGLSAQNWLRNRHTVLPVLALIGAWQNFGYATVLFLAGLRSIPPDLHDAAAVDGADATIDRLRTVTLPLLGPTTMFVIVIAGLRVFETFDTVRVLTRGGPDHASDMLLYDLYRESFEYLHTGYGAAISVVFLLLVSTLTFIQIRIMDRKVHST